MNLGTLDRHAAPASLDPTPPAPLAVPLAGALCLGLSALSALLTGLGVAWAAVAGPWIGGPSERDLLILGAATVGFGGFAVPLLTWPRPSIRTRRRTLLAGAALLTAGLAAALAGRLLSIDAEAVTDTAIEVYRAADGVATPGAVVTIDVSWEGPDGPFEAGDSLATDSSGRGASLLRRERRLALPVPHAAPPAVAWQRVTIETGQTPVVLTREPAVAIQAAVDGRDRVALALVVRGGRDREDPAYAAARARLEALAIGPRHLREASGALPSDAEVARRVIAEARRLGIGAAPLLAGQADWPLALDLGGGASAVVDLVRP